MTGFIADAGDEAAQAAKIMDEGIGGALRRLFSTLQDVGVALGQTVEQPIIRIAAVIKGLLTELGKIAALNPEITSLIILSPGILLAAGAGMIALAKSLRLAAYSAGALKAALGPIGRLLSKGTVGQLTALSQLRKGKALNAIPKGKPLPGLSAGVNLTRASAAASLTAQRVNIRNLELQRQAATSLVVQRKRTIELVAARKTLATSRRKFSGLPDFTPIPITNLAKFASFGKTFLTFANGIRRVVFSSTGLLTILEGLILFGDKIPVISNAFSALGKGFGDAFKQIGNIAKFATGPLALFRASIQAFQADRSDLGVEGLKQSFLALTSIIGNQLVAAWNKFKEAISPVYDFVVGLFTIVDTTIRSVVESVSIALGSTLSTFSKVTELFSGQGLGDLGNGFLSGVRYVAEAIAKLIPSLFNWIAQFTISFNEAGQKFLIGLEYTLNSLNPTTSQKSADDTRTAQLGTVANESRLRRKNLAEDLKNTLEGITKTFNTSSASTSRANANRAINNSLQKARESFVQAAQIMHQLQRTPQLNPQAFQQQITPQNNPLNVASVQSMKLIAEALVGSVQSTSRNLLRAGKPLEQKQLEEQEKTNEILEKIARERGIQFAP